MSRLCCINKCFYSNSENVQKNKTTFFKLPSNVANREKWLEACSGKLRKCNKMKNALYFCGKHFKESDISRNYVIRISEGITERIPRGVPRLLSTAIPSIFDNLDSKEMENSEEVVLAENRSILNPVIQKHTLFNKLQNLDSKEIEYSEEVVLAENRSILNPSSEAHEMKIVLVLDTKSEEEEVIIVEDSNDDEEEEVESSISSNSITSDSIQDDQSNSVCESYNLDNVKNDLATQLSWRYGYFDVPDGLMLYLIEEYSGKVRLNKSVLVKRDMSTEVFVKGRKVSTGIERTISCWQDLLDLVNTLRLMALCQSEEVEPVCVGIKQRKARSQFCRMCDVERRRRLNRMNIEVLRAMQLERNKIRENMKKELKRKMERFETNLQQAIQEVDELKENCKLINEESFLQKIRHLPETQQTSLKTCLEAAKYSANEVHSYEWVYECILIKVKSASLYEYIRKRNILPLPTIKTLNGYLRNIKPMYGFREETFSLLKRKQENVPLVEKRGTLLVDDIELLEDVSFDENTMKFNGFIDVGSDALNSAEKRKGDHTLVIRFQPFHGKWFQIIGAFLSKGSASSNVLHKLLLECVIQVENCGLHVDAITTSGTSWNRSMLKEFGIKGMSTSCDHPCDELRRLWFFCSFSDVLQNLRNFITSNSETWTPDGLIKLKHWEVLMHCLKDDLLKLMIPHNLTLARITPTFHKMNVVVAAEFFSDDVSAAMKIYKDVHPDLTDCEATIKFINRISGLMKALSSQTPDSALRFNSESYKAVEDILEYILEWEEDADKNDQKFIPLGTFTGLQITLKNVLKLMEFLTDQCHFFYLMTAWLNQESLEAVLESSNLLGFIKKTVEKQNLASENGVNQGTPGQVINEELLTAEKIIVTLEEDEVDDEQEVLGVSNNEEHTYHQRRGKKVAGKTNQCPICPSTFLKPSGLKIHMLIHTGERPHECPECHKRFPTLPYLNRHRMIHTGKRPYQCEICGKAFYTLNRLKNHGLVHTGERNFQCHLCLRYFAQAHHVKRHLLTHTLERPHKCDACPKAFAQRGALKFHKLTHSGERRYQCDECGKCFKLPLCLKAHKLRHSGKKPFSCEFCDKSFHNKGNLINHVRTHTGEKPYQCEQCGKTFAQVGSLSTHKLSHSGERSYQCEVCSKRFKMLSHLKRHHLHHTTVGPFKCEKCGKEVKSFQRLKCHKCPPNVDK